MALTKAQIGQRKRWANTSKKKRAELGKQHSTIAREWWAKQTDEMKSAHGTHANKARWGKQRS